MFGSKKNKDPAAPAAKPAADAGAGKPASAAQVANGAASRKGGAAPATDADAQLRAAVALRQSVAFAQIVSILMRSPHYKHYTLSDLEWLVLPPLLLGQFSVAEATEPNKPKFPAAVVLWASVSPEVDKRLAENLTSPMRLRPDEWRSGQILWLVDAVGDVRVVPELMNRLRESVFKQKDLKIRTRGKDGKPAVQVLRAGAAA